jgi:lipoprotein Spr
MTDDFVERARALVGTRFRAQGRSPETGLDCIGLALAVFGIPAELVRRDYSLRGEHCIELKAQILRFFRRVVSSARTSGDLVLSGVAKDQLHLSICAGASFIHADARLRRVVETPGQPAWPCAGVYRRRIRSRAQ